MASQDRDNPAETWSELLVWIHQATQADWEAESLGAAFLAKAGRLVGDSACLRVVEGGSERVLSGAVALRPSVGLIEAPILAGTSLFLESSERIDEPLASVALDLIAKAFLKRKAEELRICAEDAGQRGDRLFEFSLLLRGLAHEFNNHLSVLMNSMELAKEEGEAPLPDIEELVFALADARQAADRAHQLIKRVSHMVKIEHVNYAPTQLADVVLDAEYRVRHVLGQERSLEVEVDVGLPEVQVEPGYYEELLVRLVENARDATLPGGEVIVRLRVTHVEAGQTPPHPSLIPGDWVCLEVEDDGQGMSGMDAAKAFEPFHTTYKSRARLGLGLTEVRTTVAAFHGQIRLTSRPFRGTLISVFLPSTELLAKGGLPALHIETETETLPTILLLLRDRANTPVINVNLRNAGFPLVAIDSVRDIPAVLETMVIAPSLAILDDPNELRDGQGAAARLKDAVPGIKLACVGFDQPNVDCTITLPVIQQTLMDEVRRVLGLSLSR